MSDNTARQVQCASCERTQTIKSATRLPKGWKRVPQPMCATCVQARYLLRSVVVPIAFPIGATWQVFGAALKEQWAETTRAANWLVTALYAQDVRREPADTALRPMPTKYWYPELRSRFPRIAPIHLTALLHSVEQTYRRQRYELLWTGGRSLATFRWPTPIPLHTQGWKMSRETDGRYTVSLYLGHTWWQVALRGGPTVAAQRVRLDQLIGGTALPASGAICQQISRPADHRNGVGGARTRVMLKLVGWFPKPLARGAADHILRLTTGASDLLQGAISYHPDLIVIHGDPVRRAIRQYETERRRLSQDLSMMRRWIPAERAALVQRLEVIRRQQHRRLKTWCQQIAAAVVRSATQVGTGTVQYEDEERGFCQPFPWTRLRLSLQSAVEAAGIRWIYASGLEPKSDANPARKKTTAEEDEAHL